MKSSMLLGAMLLTMVAGATFGADKATRVGTCADAKKQMDYFCNPNPNDTMVAIGTACTNAKANVKEACEGVVEPDKKYEFNDKK